MRSCGGNAHGISCLGPPLLAGPARPLEDPRANPGALRGAESGTRQGETLEKVRGRSSRLGGESRKTKTVVYLVVVAEWLRRWTRNPLGSSRAGSNPADYEGLLLLLNVPSLSGVPFPLAVSLLFFFFFLDTTKIFT